METEKSIKNASSLTYNFYIRLAFFINRIKNKYAQIEMLMLLMVLTLAKPQRASPRKEQIKKPPKKQKVTGQLGFLSR